MQELREFEKGIVSRAEDILMSGQDISSTAKKGLTRSRTGSRKFLLPHIGSSVGPVAMPVMRVQGSRNILSIDNDSDGEGGEHGSGDAAPPPPGDVGAAPSKRALGAGRGFGRSAPNLRIAAVNRPVMREESIKEEDEMGRQDSTSSFAGTESVGEYDEDEKSEAGGAPTQVRLLTHPID